MKRLFDYEDDITGQLTEEEEIIDCLRQFRELLAEENPEDYLNSYIHIYNRVNDLLDYHVTLCKYVIRNHLEQFLGMAEEKESRLCYLQDEYEELEARHQKKIVSIKKYVEELTQGEDIYCYQKFFESRIADCSDPENERQIIQEMRHFGVDAWYNLYQKNLQELLFEYDGKKLPYQAFVKCLKKENDYKNFYEVLDHEEWKYDYILKQIKAHQLFVAKQREYTNPLEAILHEHRMNMRTLELLEKHFGSFSKIFDKYNAKRLKRNGMNIFFDWNLYSVQQENEDDRITFQQAQKIILDAFETVDADLAGFARLVFDEQWIDYEIREGKLPGSYTNMLHLTGKSAISTNYQENLDAVCTIAHEIGHAYHGYMLREVPFALSDYPVPIAEIFSLFCENIVYLHVLDKHEDQEKPYADIIEERFLNNIMSTFQENMVFYLFEKNVYESIKNSSDIRYSSLYRNLKMEICGKYLEPSSINSNQWIFRPNNFFVDYYYYNFPYVLGMLIAVCMIKRIREKRLKFTKIKEFLKKSGQGTFEDLVGILGFDVTEEIFWQEAENVLSELYENLQIDF